MDVLKMLNEPKMPVKLLGMIIGFFVLSPVATAKGIHCSSKSMTCEVYNRTMVVGDRVGFFTKKNELIAVGKVKEMVRKRRVIKLGKKFGPLAKARYAMRIDSLEGHKRFEGRSTYSIGGDFRLGSIAVGSGVTTNHFSGNIDRRLYRHMSLQLRGELIMGAGEIASDDFFEDTGAQPLDLQGFAVLPSLAFDSEQLGNISFRAELGLGFAYLSRSIGELDEQEIVDRLYSPKMNQGFGLAASSTVGIEYHMTSDVKLRATLQYGLLHEAMLSSLGFGLQVELD